VVSLAEAAMTLGGRRRRRVFERRRPTAVDRAHQNRPAARCEHPVDLGQGAAVVGNVLEHVVADQEVEARLPEGKVHHIELALGERRVEVAAHVAQAGQPREPLLQRVLRGDVQQRAGPLEEIGLALQEEPERAVTLERAAARAFRQLPPAMGQEARRGGTAAGALDRVAAVADAAQRPEQAMAPRARHQLQQGPLRPPVFDRAVLVAEALRRGGLDRRRRAGHTR